jgi:membrane protein required for colicin V production
MNWVDIAILIIVFLSALISVLRGFVREALSLLGLVISFWVAFTFSKDLAVYLAKYIETPSLQLATAFAILFIVTLLLMAIVNYLAGQLVEKSGLSGTDRMLGVVFGIVRGIAIVAILVLLAGLTPLPQDPWWDQSMFLKHFEALAIWLRGFLPPDIASNFVYD